MSVSRLSAFLLLALSILAISGCVQHSQKAQSQLDIYILMGQSNMAGRDTSVLGLQVDDVRVLALGEDDIWRVARDPIHKKIGRTEPGIGPGIPFAKQMLRLGNSNHIGLVPTAVGGSPLRRWMKGGDLYHEALDRAKLAREYGVIKGILWHQGESDSDRLENAETYGKRLAAMLRDFRLDLGLPTLPVVVGEMGYFLAADKFPYADDVRRGLREVADSVPNVSFVDSRGLDHKGDELHFSAASAVELGERFAAAMHAMERPPVRARIAPFAGDRSAAISYTFDDGLRDQYTLAVPMLNEVGFKGTFFVIPGVTASTLEDAEQNMEKKRAWGGIRWSELAEMAAQGHEIGSHTWSHPSLLKLEPQQVTEQFIKANDAIFEHLGFRPLSLAFPFNHSNAEVDAAALDHYIAYREFQTGVRTEQTDLAWMNQWADDLVQRSDWGVLMVHAMASGYAAFGDPEDFRQHLQYVSSLESKIWVDTFVRIARYVEERDNSRIHILALHEGSARLQLESDLNLTQFSVPLTVVLQAPNVVCAIATQAGSDLPVELSQGRVLVDAIPSKEQITIRWRNSGKDCSEIQ